MSDALVLGGVYTLFAVGLTVSWGVLNVLNLAHGAIFMAGAPSAYLITRAQALPLAVVLPAAMAIFGADRGCHRAVRVPSDPAPCGERALR